jgi:hypothetical protein
MVRLRCLKHSVAGVCYGHAASKPGFESGKLCANPRSERSFICHARRRTFSRFFAMRLICKRSPLRGSTSVYLRPCQSPCEWAHALITACASMDFQFVGKVKLAFGIRRCGLSMNNGTARTGSGFTNIGSNQPAKERCAGISFVTPHRVAG